ncbi:MAG: GNAT family N-acetyltransferase [Candidatus Lokiarchaeota archaeon]|nr:GNAT family N-acetyltransferase [Candidatus Lokiarchaeota archaeon]
MAKHIILKSSRLLLRPLLEEDFQGFLELQKENNKLDWFQSKNDIKKIYQFIKEDKFNNYIFSIILKNSNSFIGLCGLEIIETKLRAKIFYAFLSNFWGNGYGWEAINNIIKFAFSELSLNEITAHINNGNTRGWKVVERVGLKYMGQINVNNKKVMLFSINKKEYLNQNWY